jgi:hypothetical protein
MAQEDAFSKRHCYSWVTLKVVLHKDNLAVVGLPGRCLWTANGPSHHNKPSPDNSEYSLAPLNLATVDLDQERGFSSGVSKMLEAILFFLMGCSVGSSEPSGKLGPPPGGCKIL